jgi:replicative DNA helicase
VAAYYAEIGWIGEKAERVFKSYDPARRRSNNGHAPVDVWETIRKVSRGRGLSLAELNRRAGDRPDSLHTNRSVPSRRLGKYAEILDDDRLLLAASRDIYWDQIDAIEDIGSHQVYDLTVPDGANFVANDVCVHNTAFALGLAYGAAVQHGRTVGVFSLEMAAEQLVQRLLSTETGVDSHRLRLGQIDDHEWDRVSRAFGRLAEAQIYIDDSAGLNVMEVRTKARRLQAEHGLDMLVIDYLQLMHARRSENRVQEISEISRGLKGLARELNIPVIALSQLSRAVETRSDHHPMLSDLRESGCLDGDTPVYLPDEGTWVPIRALVGRADVRVLALNEDTWKLEPQRILSAFATGHKPVFKLRTRLGRVIRATANHKFLTVQGWKRLDELDVSCHIALPRQLPGSGTPSMSKDELALLGHLIGDGCTLSRQPIHYTTADEDLAILVSDLGSKVFGDKIRPRVAREREWYQVYLAANGPLGHGTRNAVAAWLDGMGIFNLRSWEKRIPVAVFAQPRDEIACFLRHLWSTDGSLWLPRSTKAAPRIYYATSSPELASGVQSLLLRIGILASVSRHGQGSKGRDQYHVDVNGLPDQQRFLEIVGGVGQRKLRAAESISERNASKITNTNRDILPRDVWQIYALPAKRAIGMTERRFQAALGNHYCGSGLYRQNVSRERAARIAQIVACEKLARLARSDVYWDQVVSIEPDGEADVFDLTIEGLHNFVAGDVIVHNSIEQDADIVIFLYRDEIYDPNTERKGIAEVIVAKHRNGPVGTVNLRFFEKTARFADLELYRESSS